MTDPEAEAQEALDAAVEMYVQAMGWGQGFTTHWALVGHQSMVDNGEERDLYITMYKRGSCPDHVALGLFTFGIDSTKGRPWGRRRADDD